jgi:hypothetical protein
MFRSVWVTLFGFGLSLSTANADEAQMREDFQELKFSTSDYQPFGTVCEQVAKLRLEETFTPDRFEVVTGIGYFHRSGRQIGELDVVVIRKADQEAVVVAEVKCWNDLTSARKKAWKQLNRFRDNLEDETPIKMHLMEDQQVRFSSSQFDDNPQFMTISQNGGLQSGFDMEIGLDMDEAKRLREMIMRCQNTGQCGERPRD